MPVQHVLASVNNTGHGSPCAGVAREVPPDVVEHARRSNETSASRDDGVTPAVEEQQGNNIEAGPVVLNALSGVPYMCGHAAGAMNLSEPPSTGTVGTRSLF